MMSDYNFEQKEKAEKLRIEELEAMLKSDYKPEPHNDDFFSDTGIYSDRKLEREHGRYSHILYPNYDNE